MPLKLTEGESKYEFWITGPFAFLGISYMDHLSFPRNCGHVFNKSLPRVCFVTNNDFDFVVEHDLELKILNNTTVFGWRPFLPLSETPYNTDLGNEQVNEAPPAHTLDESEVNLSASLNEWLVFPSSQELEVPARFKHLAEKHMAFWASDVETTMKNLVVGLKMMHSQCMAALLVDIDAQLKDGAGPSVMFPADAGLDNEEERENVFEEQEPFDGLNKSDDVEASVYAAKEDVAEARRDEAKEDDTKAIEDEAKENEAAAIRDSDDVEGDADKVAAGIPTVEVPDSAPSVAAETSSVVDRTEPCVVPIDSSAKGDGSSGMVTHEKKTRFKRAAKEELTPPKSKKIKQYHIFDSMKLDKGAGLLDELARNLFLNFTTLVDASKLAPKLAKDMELYLLKTPDHPQQVTLFDCGFFGILFMENFNGKVMAEFDNNYCSDLRRTLAADLIEARENQDSAEKLMEEELNPK
uniref:Uncharacterized protein n=1 Tax=Avena sativa TaxID=4498 RepID=A0ACD6AQN9_AVESA